MASSSVPPLKRCTKCGQEKPATPEFFCRATKESDGLRDDCKTCLSDYSRRRYQASPTKIHQSQKLTPEQNRERNRRWREKHRDYDRERKRRWAKENPEKNAANARNYEARKLAAEGTHTASDIDAQLKRQNSRCYFCGCKLTSIPHLPNSQTVDHIVPLSRGGSNSPDNLVLACAHCNFSKHDKLPHEWPEGGRLL